MKMNKTKMKYGTNHFIVIVAVLVIVILVNLLLSAWVANAPIKIDLTRNKVYTLSNESKDIIDNLQDKVTLYYITDKDNENDQIIEVLDLYKKSSGNISVVQMENAEKNPTFLNEHGVMYLNTIVAINDNTKKSRTISPTDMLKQTTDSNNYDMVMLNSHVEGQISAAISFVSNADTPKIYYSQGHGEQDFTTPKNMLSGENIASAPIDLTTQDIPEDADMLIINGPMLDFEQDAIVKLDSYFERGGKVQFYAEASVTLPNLNAYLEQEWGIVLENDIVVERDKSSQIAIGYNSFLIPQIQQHDITEYVINNKGSVLWPNQDANSITILENDKVEAVPLLTSSEDSISYSVAQLQEQDRTQLPAPYKEGTMNLLVYCRKNALNNTDTTARLLVGGTIAPLYLDTSEQKFMNKELLIRSINYMAGFEDAPVLIQPKIVGEASLVLDDLKGDIYTVLLLIVLPLALFASGIFVWIRRRHL